MQNILSTNYFSTEIVLLYITAIILWCSPRLKYLSRQPKVCTKQLAIMCPHLGADARAAISIQSLLKYEAALPKCLSSYCAPSKATLLITASFNEAFVPFRMIWWWKIGPWKPNLALLKFYYLHRKAWPAWWVIRERTQDEYFIENERPTLKSRRWRRARNFFPLKTLCESSFSDWKGFLKYLSRRSPGEDIKFIFQGNSFAWPLTQLLLLRNLIGTPFSCAERQRKRTNYRWWRWSIFTTAGSARVFSISSQGRALPLWGSVKLYLIYKLNIRDNAYCSSQRCCHKQEIPQQLRDFLESAAANY